LHTTLQFVAFRVDDTTMANEMGVVLADAIEHSKTLQFFTLEVRDTGGDIPRS
jgi:hypothetical protein